MDFTGKKREGKRQIHCHNLSVGYGQQVVASGVSFDVYQGDYLCIVGENGSGKSTLMKTLLGMQPPIAGTLEIAEDLRGGIGYLPQQSVMQRDFPASVREIVISGLQRKVGWRPYYNKEEKRLAEEAMAKLHIEGLARKSYRALSGGQQQRVLLARAILASGDILLLDEPVSGLDPGAMEEMYALIETLNEEGMTILMISHDVQKSMEYASHILHMGEVPYFMPRGEHSRSQHWQKLGKTEAIAPDAPLRRGAPSAIPIRKGLPELEPEKERQAAESDPSAPEEGGRR